MRKGGMALAPALYYVETRAPREGSARQLVLAFLILTLILSLIRAAQVWGFPTPRTLHITMDGQTFMSRSFRHTVAGVLAANKITLNDGDRVIPGPDTVIWPGIHIFVIRAVPVVLAVGGTVRFDTVAAQTVGGALELLGVPIGPLDRVYPDVSSLLTPHMRITVERRVWQTWLERHAIPFGSQVVKDEGLWKGLRIVRSQGREGVEERAIRVLYANGQAAQLDPRPWVVVENPLPQVIAVGAQPRIATTGQFAGQEYMTMEATAYYPGPLNYGGGVGDWTASGILARRGVVAVDPSVIPLGTRLYIEDYGYAVAADTGGMIKGTRIDLCFNTYQEAMQYGRHTVMVYLLDGR
jgi:3D (Asp-Asp-Asp) domain-containing protein